ncbi:MAG: trigger factor [Patescibacteria group bacterium]
MELKITKLENSEVELTGEIAAEKFESFRTRALAKLNQEVKIDGFRTGHIPADILASKIGEEKILLEMAELALQNIYPEILQANKIDALGRPAITLTKIAKGNPLGFVIKTAVRPEFTLPDYTKLEKPETEIIPEITEKEVDEVVENIKKNQETQKIEPEKITEITAEQREIIKQNLKLERERRNREKTRLKIMDNLLEQAKITLPNVLVESELDKMAHEMKHQIEQMGLKFEDYLKHIKKEEKDLRADWQSEAEKRLKTGLLIAEIAKQAKLEPKPEEIEKEVKHLQEHYKDVPAENLRHYVSEMLLVEMVWKLLENK